MCLGIPARVVKIEGRTGIAGVGGVTRPVLLDLVPEVKEGDYVLIHAGCAMQIIDEAQAAETLELLRRLADETPA